MLARKAPEAEFTVLRLRKDADGLSGRGRLLFDGRRTRRPCTGRTAAHGAARRISSNRCPWPWRTFAVVPTTPGMDDFRDEGGRATSGAVAEEAGQRRSTTGKQEVGVTPGAVTELPTTNRTRARPTNDAPAPDATLSSRLRGHPYGWLLVPTGNRLPAHGLAQTGTAAHQQRALAMARGCTTVADRPASCLAYAAGVQPAQCLLRSLLVVFTPPDFDGLGMREFRNQCSFRPLIAQPPVERLSM